MELIILLFLFCVIIGSLGYGLWQRRPPSPAVKKQMYKELEHRAKEGDKEAMYKMASLFYEEKDERYYPQIFKWSSILAAQEKDPAVWLLLGDLYALGCGTLRDPKRALSSYEQALSADIASGRNTDLTKEAHDYLERRIICLRQEVFKQTNNTAITARQQQ